MRAALIGVTLSLVVLPLGAQMRRDSDLVRAARDAVAVTRHSKIPPITNDTLARTGGHMSTAEGEVRPPTLAAYAMPASSSNGAPAPDRSATYAPSGVGVSVGAAHLASPPAPAYAKDSMAPSIPAIASTQAVATTANVPISYLSTVTPTSAGTTASPTLVSVTPMTQMASAPFHNE